MILCVLSAHQSKAEYQQNLVLLAWDSLNSVYVCCWFISTLIPTKCCKIRLRWIYLTVCSFCTFAAHGLCILKFIYCTLTFILKYWHSRQHFFPPRLSLSSSIRARSLSLSLSVALQIVFVFLFTCSMAYSHSPAAFQLHWMKPPTLFPPSTSLPSASAAFFLRIFFLFFIHLCVQKF